MVAKQERRTLSIVKDGLNTEPPQTMGGGGMSNNKQLINNNRTYALIGTENYF